MQPRCIDFAAIAKQRPKIIQLISIKMKFAPIAALVLLGKSRYASVVLDGARVLFCSLCSELHVWCQSVAIRVVNFIGLLQPS
jgi:hypothetical protein